ncbi:calcium/proton exchanger [Nodosilinea sp. E11]|uniref:calcium/proton exchanger n=1 Tax=Nodosilinea sp. E11 TaxID=3037479 RepID=UPI002934239E|nr:calcium/proton exchanger [Nodosilinea sp. E11]WOD41333.1 calcium/proton exchanger [Nodosilinea sp. E11]
MGSTTINLKTLSPKTVIFAVLTVFIPISLLAHWLEWGAIAIFLTAALAILPLAGLIGEATEAIAVVLGPAWGGLLNATFGNMVELIIALFALRAGLVDVVKASITGSIVSNLLLVMGVSMLLGGLRYKVQTFQPMIARVNSSAMNLAVIAILLPTTIDLVADVVPDETIQTLSNAVAIVLIVVYGLSLVFTMKTHAYLQEESDTETGAMVTVQTPPPVLQAISSGDWSAIAEAPTTTAIAIALAPDPSEPSDNLDLPVPKPPLRVSVWIGILLVTTLIVAVESELLIDNLAVATDRLGLTQLFTGVILLPLVGNAAEHAAAVSVAIKNKMDLAMAIAVGSSMQVALFMGPVLVLAGWLLHQPMNLDFGPLDLVAVGVAVLIANSISMDGRSNWLEGVLLIAAYTVLALAFFFYPAP